MGRLIIDENGLTGVESQLLRIIDQLNCPPKGRTLSPEQWWVKCVTIENKILIAISDGRLPNSLRISRFVRNKYDYWTKGIITRPEYERQFQAVTDYLEEKENPNEEVRAREERARLEGLIE